MSQKHESQTFDERRLDILNMIASWVASERTQKKGVDLARIVTETFQSATSELVDDLDMAYAMNILHLKAKRQSMDLTQAQMAGRLGTSQGIVSQVERRMRLDILFLNLDKWIAAYEFKLTAMEKGKL